MKTEFSCAKALSAVACVQWYFGVIAVCVFACFTSACVRYGRCVRALQPVPACVTACLCERYGQCVRALRPVPACVTADACERYGVCASTAAGGCVHWWRDEVKETGKSFWVDFCGAEMNSRRVLSSEKKVSSNNDFALINHLPLSLFFFLFFLSFFSLSSFIILSFSFHTLSNAVTQSRTRTHAHTSAGKLRHRQRDMLA